jgi:hypothetical protein
MEVPHPIRLTVAEITSDEVLAQASRLFTPRLS